MDGQEKRPGSAVLIYLMPALMDMALSLVLFVGTVRIARLGGDATRSATVLAIWSLVYIAACPLIGRIVTPGNARRLVLSGCLLFAVACAALAAAATYVPMIFLVGVTGLSSALFFISFQIFMKDVDAAGGRPMTYSVGLYTFAWSAGFACGPLASGFIMQFGTPAAGGGEGSGWRFAFLFGASVALALSAVLAIAFRDRNQSAAITPAAPSRVPDPRYAAMPDLAWLGWIAAATGFAALSVNRTVFASRAVSELHLADGTIGTIFFALCIAQAFTGLALIRSRFWMYRPLPVAAFALPGIAGLLCLAFGQHVALLVAGGALFGVYSGAFCFYLVFHSLVHPEHAGKYVAVNETIVGLSSFVAPLIGGKLADMYGFPNPFLVAAGLLVLTAVFQCAVHRRKRSQIREQRSEVTSQRSANV